MMFCDTRLTFITVLHRMRLRWLSMMKRMLFCDVHFIFVITKQGMRAVTEELWRVLECHVQNVIEAIVFVIDVVLWHAFYFRHRCGLFDNEFWNVTFKMSLKLLFLPVGCSCCWRPLWTYASDRSPYYSGFHGILSAKFWCQRQPSFDVHNYK